jgi:hypothetical protein
MNTVSKESWKRLEAEKTVSKPFPNKVRQGFGSGCVYLYTHRFQTTDQARPPDHNPEQPAPVQAVRPSPGGI